MASTIERRSETMPRLVDWFDDLLPWLERSRPADLMRIEESTADGNMVIKAEMPGLDPEKDVDIMVRDGRLTIRAERRQESDETKDGTTRTEFRYGSFVRTLAVPRDCQPSDITAGYKDGILTITVPIPAAVPAESGKVQVTRQP